MAHDDSGNGDLTRSVEQILTSALRTLDEIETILIHLDDPHVQHEITTVMAQHAGDHSGYSGLIDWVQFDAAYIRDYLDRH